MTTSGLLACCDRSARWAGASHNTITICINGYIDFGSTGGCSAGPKQIDSGMQRVAAFWYDMVADNNATDCASLSGSGTYGSAVSYRIGTSNDGLVDALVNGGSAPGAPTFRSTNWIAVSFFGLRLYSAKASALCNERLHAQIVIASAASSTYAVLIYAPAVPEINKGNPARAGLSMTSDSIEMWPSLDAQYDAFTNLSASQQLGGKGNAGVPGRWVFRIDSGFIQYGLPHPSFVPAEMYQVSLTSSAPFTHSLFPKYVLSLHTLTNAV